MADDFDAFNDIMYEIHRLHTDNRPDIYCQIGKPTDHRAWDFERLLSDETAELFGVEIDGRIVGICQMTIKQSAGNKIIAARRMAYINELGVSESFRRQGIGTILYNEAVRRAAELKAESVELNVWAFNQRAIEFYKSLGMEMQRCFMEKKL